MREFSIADGMDTVSYWIVSSQCVGNEGFPYIMVMVPRDIVVVATTSRE